MFVIECHQTCQGFDEGWPAYEGLRMQIWLYIYSIITKTGVHSRITKSREIVLLENINIVSVL